MTSISINIGGEGEAIESSLTIKGCACRHDDFVMALVKFANDWKKAADARVAKPLPEGKPCGCSDAK